MSVEQMAHSRLGASSSHRWMNCPASAVLPQSKEYKPSIYAAEGTVAHELAERVVRSIQAGKPKKLVDFIGQKFVQDGFEFIVDETMTEHVRTYLTHLVDTIGSLSALKVEARFNLDWLFPGMFGTCDAHAYKDRVLHVFDLKYGAGTPVYAEGNTQLMYYALGILGREGFKKVDTVSLHIVQPRCDSGITVWDIDVIDLFAFAYGELLPAAKSTKQPDPETVSGEWCQWCNCMGDCPQISNDLVAVFEKDATQGCIGELEFPLVTTLTPVQKAQLLSIRKVLSGYLDAVYETSLTDAMNGNLLDGFKLVNKRAGNRKWKDEKLVINAFKDKGIDIFDAPKLKSPSQLEKLEGVDDISSFVYRLDTGLELVSELDRRKAVNIDDSMANVFDVE